MEYIEINEFIEKILNYFSNEPLLNEIKKAKALFMFEKTEILESDTNYDRFMNCFTNWFVFDCQNLEIGIHVLDYYYKKHESMLTEKEKNVYQSLKRNIHTLFQIKKIKVNKLVLLDLYSKKKYIITESVLNKFLKNDLIFEGWVIPDNENMYLLKGNIFHSLEVVGLLKKAMKKYSLNELINLSWKAKVKSDRYSKLDIKNIYKAELQL